MAEIPAKVASLLDSSLVAFNVGSVDGVKVNDKVTLWRTADLTDPDTQQSLGKLKMELLRLVVVHVQDALCVAQITSPAEGNGPFGIVTAGWEKHKSATDRRQVLDDVNTVEVHRGDEATVYSSDELRTRE